ncbi:MAG TPA: anaerobic ribonucleoside-triphosphate reductase activating protein [Desulfotomaculum sp.]|nr:MAG: Anaerobic ribonucleoside-triphosphate reductase activating protein [Desulfotomaculum sp. 46_80]HAG11518.1 anaerobic ribonucleoside-triphosphate reductase activating protein [Desulfotomaculum sp.]HBY04675.1 anaerobic ribonucleoside-triphosphate reductase activating protein [Desulfotomaculum sp.]
MLIGGYTRFSLIEYPGRICAVIFTKGCNFKCPYCHNPELVKSDPRQTPALELEVLDFLKRRQGKLDGVVVTGGEPTIQANLIPFLEKIKKIGYPVKLNTNGSLPSVLKNIISLELVDYVAMDIKAPFDKYCSVTNSLVDLKKILQSISLIINSRLDYEFRTTLVKSLLTPEDILEISKTIKGAKLYILQKFVPSKLLDPKFLKEETYNDEELINIAKQLEEFVEKCMVR